MQLLVKCQQMLSHNLMYLGSIKDSIEINVPHMSFTFVSTLWDKIGARKRSGVAASDACSSRDLQIGTDLHEMHINLTAPLPGSTVKCVSREYRIRHSAIDLLFSHILH